MGIFTDNNSMEECPECKRIVRCWGGFSEEHICTPQKEQEKGVRRSKKILSNMKRFVEYETNPVTVESRKIKSDFNIYYDKYKNLDWDIDPVLKFNLDRMFERDIKITRHK